MVALEFSAMSGKSLGERLKTARTNAELTQEQLAARVGVSRGVISQWETGLIERIGAEHLANCAAAMRVSLDWLLSGDEGVTDVAHPVYVGDRNRALLDAWEGLTSSHRAEFLRQIQAAADHNKALLEELTRRG